MSRLAALVRRSGATRRTAHLSSADTADQRSRRRAPGAQTLRAVGPMAAAPLPARLCITVSTVTPPQRRVTRETLAPAATRPGSRCHRLTALHWSPPSPWRSNEAPCLRSQVRHRKHTGVVYFTNDLHRTPTPTPTPHPVCRCALAGVRKRWLHLLFCGLGPGHRAARHPRMRWLPD